MKRGEEWVRADIWSLFSRVKIEDVIEDRVYYRCANPEGPFDIRVGALTNMQRLYQREGS